MREVILHKPRISVCILKGEPKRKQMAWTMTVLSKMQHSLRIYIICKRWSLSNLVRAFFGYCHMTQVSLSREIRVPVPNFPKVLHSR